MITDKKTKSRLLCILVPVACSIIFMIFCMLNLGSSIWFDEAYSAFLVRGNFADIWSSTAIDVHPPFFYFCLKIWTLIFGYNDFSMRFMSVFFGALAIIFFFHLIKRWFGTKAATVSTFFLSLSPMLIRYGQEMRMYTLVFFIIILATYVLDLTLETKKTRYFCLYAVLVALGMWTHYFTALAWLAQLFYIVVIRKEKLFSKKWILTYIGAVVLFLPWLPSFITQLSSVQKGFWIPDVSIITPLGFLSESFLFRPADEVVGWLIPLLLVIILLAGTLIAKVIRQASGQSKKRIYLLATLIVIPPLLLILLSLPPLTSVYVDRYIVYSCALIWAFVGLVIILGFMRHKILSIILVIAMLLSAGFGIFQVETAPRDGKIKQTIVAIHTMSDRGEPILVNDEWNFYDAVFYSNDDFMVYANDEWLDYEYGSYQPIKTYHYNITETLSEFTNTYDRFWYLTYADDEAVTNNTIEQLFSGYHVTTEIIGDHHAAFELEKL